MLPRGVIVKMNSLCESCLGENCLEEERLKIIFCDKYVSGEDSYDLFISWINKVSSELERPDPFLAVYSLGGYSNA